MVQSQLSWQRRKNRHRRTRAADIPPCPFFRRISSRNSKARSAHEISHARLLLDADPERRKFLSDCQNPGKTSARTTESTPAETVDHLTVSLRADIDLTGVGKDSVVLRGTMALHRSGPTGSEGQTIVGDCIGVSLRGTSKSLGPVYAMESPIRHSRCEFKSTGADGYTGQIDLNCWLWLPARDLVLFAGKPIQISGDARFMPPVGMKSEVVPEEIFLYDFHKPAARAIGVLSNLGGEIHGMVDIESYLTTRGTTVSVLGRTR